MKKVVSISIIVISFAALAQESVSTGSLKSMTSKKHEGLRVGVLKSMLDAKINLDGIGSGKTRIDTNIWGLTVGYRKLPLGQMGYVTDLTYLLESEKPGNGILRAAGNIAYAPDETLHVRGGANLTKMVGEKSSDFSARVGLQAAVGIQVTPTVAFELGYASMKQGFSFNGFSGDTEFYGLELGIAGTF